MEKLFERYVARWLRQQLPAEAVLRTPARSQSLCRHAQQDFFQLQPDLFVTHQGQAWVLDTKWKLLDASDRARRYGLSQSDFYQLYAYGQKYLGGQGRMALVYPATERFQAPLPAFAFDERLHLEVLPFDLERETMGGLERLGLPQSLAACGLARAA